MNVSKYISIRFSSVLCWGVLSWELQAHGAVSGRACGQLHSPAFCLHPLDGVFSSNVCSAMMLSWNLGPVRGLYKALSPVHEHQLVDTCEDRVLMPAQPWPSCTYLCWLEWAGGSHGGPQIRDVI